ncbi:unnamed protein product [Acanthoscelides obtectus]|uniref:Uncharacterized protein n=1 Tax=Acanthoscelides obtectus TaxID=200917 RepID=A0A9P0JMT4_ACAOB|nr:unnamed protein product [Acanthoscelides obtectus]CAK1621298.1 hypothetical protein AOBTE_LOCUS878 [Acanthoscelides obtectus]
MAKVKLRQKTPQKKVELEIRTERARKNIFKPNIKCATAVVGAVAFLQKTGLVANVRNIKNYIKQRFNKSLNSFKMLPNYLNRGVELGLLKKHGGAYKIEELVIKRKRRMRKPKESHEIHTSERSKHNLSQPNITISDGDRQWSGRGSTRESAPTMSEQTNQ